HLLKRAHSSKAMIRYSALSALSEIKPEESVSYLESALQDSASEVRIVAIESLLKTEKGKQIILKNALDLVRDKNRAVAVTEVRALKDIRQTQSVKMLLEYLPRAPITLHYDIICSISGLTGLQLGFDTKIWLNWYEANKDKIEVSSSGEASAFLGTEGKTISGMTIPTFFDIPAAGNRIVFIIDFSGSMKYSAKESDSDGSPVRERKIDLAIKELENTLKTLKEDTRFNIIILSTEATRIGKRKAFQTMLPALADNKKQALNFIKSLWDRLEDIRRGRGDHYDALIEALSEPEVDTVFLLSDGSPTYGTYIYDDNIIENIYNYNLFKKVVIHTIITGKKGTDVELMKKLSGISNGICLPR
ncbi:MAG: hypothetical protein QME51_08940, partial [Planctomycetota bacterium]|nr:hypothetical protein [Planctomycetota bacterium]